MQRFPFGKNYKEETENIKYRKKTLCISNMVDRLESKQKRWTQGKQECRKEETFPSVKWSQTPNIYDMH